MASIFTRSERKKSASFELNEEPPEFELLFLGKKLTERKMGRECTAEIVNELVKRSQGKQLKQVRLSITCRGIWVIEASSDPKKGLRETFVPIYSISYGSADKQYARVFSFVTNFTKDDPNIAQGRKSNMPFQCYAFVCRSTVIARVMVVYLLRSFKTAYESWRREVKSRRLRDKIKAGPGHNVFGHHEISNGAGGDAAGAGVVVVGGGAAGGDEGGAAIVGGAGGGSGERSVANTIARLDELMAGKARIQTNNHHSSQSDKSSDSSMGVGAGEKAATPPDEVSTRTDKVVLWMDKWIASSNHKKVPSSAFNPLTSSDESSESGPETMISDLSARNAAESNAFTEREQEFDNPAAMLNEEVDIVSELQDPQVRQALEHLVNAKTNKHFEIFYPPTT